MFYPIFLSALTMMAGANAGSISMLFDVGTDQPNYISANLVSNGTTGEAVLKGERLSVYPGTPFSYVGNTLAPTDLFFIDDGLLYGAQVPETGSDSAFAAPILALSGKHGDSGWTRSDGQVTHTRIPSGQGFYACQDIVAGEAATVLSWGIDGPNGELPAGCNATKVIAQSISTC